jgi:hypothetical protein
LLVDWYSGWNVAGASSDIAAQLLASRIHTFLEGRPDGEKWDLLFVGHSRGAILNSRAVARLSTFAGIEQHVDRTEVVALDATAVLDWGDWGPISGQDRPNVMPPMVDRAVVYDDARTLNGILERVTTGILGKSVLDGFAFRPELAEDTNIVSRKVGGLVDHYLATTTGTLEESSPSKKYSECRDENMLSETVAHALDQLNESDRQSILSHLNVHCWYIDSGYLTYDVSRFLAAKDSQADTGPTSDDDGSAGKLPSGHSNSDGPSSGDDHPDQFGNDATFLTVAKQVVGAVHATNDHDWFQFRAAHDGPINIEVTPLHGSLTPYVRFHWDNKILIRHDTGGGVGGAAKISYSGGEAGRTYYIDVAGAGGSTGSYVIRVTQPATADPDAADNNPPDPPTTDDYPNSMPTAHQVALNGDGDATVSGAIGAVGDDDWFTFRAQKTGHLVIEIDTPNSSLDTHLRLHNNAVLLAQNHSRIERSVTAGETYWIHVRAGSENGSGDIAPGEDPTGGFVLKIRQPDTVSNGPPGPLEGWGGVNGIEINLDPNGNGQSSGSIDDPADVRWFQIDGAGAGNMVVQVLPVNDDLKPFVTAFRADGGGIDTDTGEFDGEAKVGFQVAENERIIVAVRSHNSRYTGGFTIHIEQPGTLPDDPEPDFGDTPRNLDPQVDDHGNGAFSARIESPDDNDWFTFALVGEGYVHVEVETQDGALVPFLELNRDGTNGGFFETDDGRDGRAHVAFLPSSETAQNNLFVKVSALDGTQGSYTLRVWRSASINDDHPDSGGQFAAPHQLTSDGMVIIRGRIEHPGDNDAFRVEPKTPGPVAIQVISLTEGFSPFLEESWSPADSNGDLQNTDGGSGRGGRTFHVIDSNVTHVNIDVSGGSVQPYGDYVVYVWQPESAADIDADTIGIEASPILLDGTGNGSLPGQPNGSEPAPALNHAGDKDCSKPAPPATARSRSPSAARTRSCECTTPAAEPSPPTTTAAPAARAKSRSTPTAANSTTWKSPPSTAPTPACTVSPSANRPTITPTCRSSS